MMLKKIFNKIKSDLKRAGRRLILEDIPKNAGDLMAKIFKDLMLELFNIR